MATAPAAQAPAASWRDRLIEPVTAPTTFESPVIDTQVRPMIIRHEIPSDAATGKGRATVIAVQARVAVTEDLAIIAVKDGWIDLRTQAFPDDTGYADVAAGVKYSFFKDAQAGTLVTGGLVYETDMGNGEVFQGNGDGVIRPFVSAGHAMGKFNFLGELAYNWVLDDKNESTSYDWHLHCSYDWMKCVVPLVEINGIEWTDGGEGLAIDDEGGDLINLGSQNVDGSVVSGAIGARFPYSANLSFGLGYEWPLSTRGDLLDERITFDAVWSF